jgi:hypothetical protein
VDKASSRLGGIKESGQILICLDQHGYVCSNGGDFMASRDKDRFPVTAYILKRSKNNQ